MTDSQSAQFAVILPITELRGEAADHVRSWTRDQTLPRQRYRVLIGCNRTELSHDDVIAPLLCSHDEIMVVPGGSTEDIMNAGAARAGTPWLVFTEGHCLAAPDCLQALARWIEANPDAVVGNFDLTHRDGGLLDRVVARWYDAILGQWRAPDCWPRLIQAGFAIRTDVFENMGMLEPRYGMFAAILMSAQMHERGINIGTVPGAAILHVDPARMSEHHGCIGHYACLEFDARARGEPEFMERYFGHAPLWANQFREHPRVARAMIRAVWCAARARPKRMAELLSLLGPLATAAVAGLDVRAGLHRLLITLKEIALERLPLSEELRWKLFNRAHARVVHLSRLEWIRRNFALTPNLQRPSAFGRRPIEGLGPETFIGVHALEEHGGRRFRWTEPVALLRLDAPEGGCELRIETGGLRGDPLTSLIAVVVGGRILPRDLLAAKDGKTLTIQLPRSWAAAACEGLVLVCSTQRRIADPRHLGLPILAVATAPLPEAQLGTMAT